MVLKAKNGGLMSEASVFANLLYIDALRGDDSTGIALMANDGEIRVVKEATTADYFLSTKEYTSIQSAFIKNGKAIIGHNRKKTSGSIKDETAHPFVVHGRYAFVHNGTLHSHKHLSDTEVDSEALALHLTTAEGVPVQVEDKLRNVHGAYSLAWMDQEKEHLYLLRNKDRPMWLATTTLGWVFASEPSFIYAACFRNNVKVEECKETEEDTLYTFDCVNGTVKEDKLVVKKSMPLLIQTQKQGLPGTTNNTDTGGAHGNANSKSFFKKFRNSRIGSIISFFAQDYVEKDVDGKPDSESWLVWGESPDIEKTHVIQGYMYGKTTQQMHYTTDRLLSGRILAIAWDKECSTMILTVANITEVMGSTQAAMH